MTHAERPVVCIIDDDPSVRDSLVSLVECCGYAAVSFANAEQFLQAGAMPEAEFLIVDVRLPGISGIDLLVRLANTPLARPAAVITGHADRQELPQTPKLDGVAFLSKPSDPDELLDLIAASVRRNIRD